jgi:hypothetical protein
MNRALRLRLKKLLLYPAAIYLLLISLEIVILKVLSVDTNDAYVWIGSTMLVTALLVAVAVAAKPANLKDGVHLGTT